MEVGNLIAVDCPKEGCGGKMVPLSGYVYEGVTKKVILFDRWECVKCGYTIHAIT